MIINTVAIYQCFLFLLLLQDKKTFATFAIANKKGAIAQLVEQRTENPCVPGSIPGGTTFRKRKIMKPAEIQSFQWVFSLSTTRRNMQFGAIKNCRFGGFF